MVSEAVPAENETGAGAFMTRLEDSLTLARTMIALRERRGCPTVALLTDMDAPLGVACGNAVEIIESVEVLKGGGPDDLREDVLALAAEMLVVAGTVEGLAAARRRAERALASGAALDKFRAIVGAQGGDPDVADDPTRILPAAPVRSVFTAERDGFVQRVEPRIIGRAITALGGGRTKVDDIVDPSVGFLVHARPGQAVRTGDPLATILARNASGESAARAALVRAISIGPTAPTPRPLISHRVTREGVEELPGAGAS